MSSAATRRFAIATAPRVASFVPKTLTWQSVRCYASGSSLDKTEVYERIKQLLSGFDKVSSASHSIGHLRQPCAATKGFSDLRPEMPLPLDVPSWLT
jgi:hypothetical protein